MTNSNSPVVVPRKRSRIWKISAAALCCFLMLAAAVFFSVGRWLVDEDPVENAAAIAVLSGRMPLRVIEAAKLYREGYAPEVWLTHSTQPAETLASMRIAFYGEEYYNKLILLHQGVPERAIRVLEPPIVNTADELTVIGTALSRTGHSSIIIVTTKPHTRRVHLLWRRMAAGKSRAIVRAASGDPFDPAHWWRDTGDALDVVREVLGLLNAWAGLPLRPAH